MNFIAGIIVIIIIFCLGYGFVYFLKKIGIFFTSISDTIHLSLAAGTAIIVFVGIFDGLRSTGDFSRFYYILILLGCMFSILLVRNIIRGILTLKLVIKESWYQYKFLYILLLTLCITVVVFQLILPPLRGFDALWRYFPESLVFYQLNRIPVLDYLVYRPVTYEPVNTLLYTFSYYLITQPELEFIPLLYLFAFLLLAYNFSKQIFKDEHKYLVSVCLLFFTPLFHWLLEYWMYYQELYVLYFFSLTIYAELNYFQTKEKNLSYLILFAMSFSLTVLSKLNGWILLPIVILLIPMGDIGRYIKSAVIILLFLLLSLVGSTVTFLWIFIPLSLYTLLLVAAVFKSDQASISKKRFILFSSSFVLAIVFGATWLYNIILRLPVGFSDTIGKYFAFGHPSSVFPIITSGSNLILEHMQDADIYLVIFVVFLSQAFVAPWLIPKIFAFKKCITQDYLIIWLFIPVMVWLAEFGIENSIRYLFPILLPFVFLSTEGIFSFWDFLRKYNSMLPEKPTILYLSFFFVTGLLNFYPIIPLIFLIRFPIDPVQTTLALQESYYISSNVVLQITLALIFFALLFLIFVKIKTFGLQRLAFLYQHKYWPSLSFFFILVIMALTFLAYTSPFSLVLVANDGNLNTTRAAYDPYSTPEYTDMIQYLINENVINTTILDAGIPGISFYTNIPTLDLREDPTPFLPIFKYQNVTEGLQLFRDPLYASRQQYGLPSTLTAPSVGYIVVPNIHYYGYDYFLSEQVPSTYLYQLIYDQLLFTKSFGNDQFIVYKSTGSIPSRFFGIVNAKISFSNASASLLSSDGSFSGQNPNLNLVIDTSLQTLGLQNLTVVLKLLVDGSNSTKSFFFDNLNKDGFSTLQIPLQSLPTSFNLQSIYINATLTKTSNLCNAVSLIEKIPMSFTTLAGTTTVFLNSTNYLFSTS